MSGAAHLKALATAMIEGPVFAELGDAPELLKRILPRIQPALTDAVRAQWAQHLRGSLRGEALWRGHDPRHRRHSDRRRELPDPGARPVRGWRCRHSRTGGGRDQRRRARRIRPGRSPPASLPEPRRPRSRDKRGGAPASPRGRWDRRACAHLRRPARSKPCRPSPRSSATASPTTARSGATSSR